MRPTSAPSRRGAGTTTPPFALAHAQPHAQSHAPHAQGTAAEDTVAVVMGHGGAAHAGAAPSHAVGRDSGESTVLCLRMDTMSTTAQLLVCVGGVFVFYLLYAIFQEWIFRLEGFRPYGWYLTLVQFFFYVCFGCVERWASGKKDERRLPLKTYALIALLTVATMGLSNTSLGYLNYPTQVIFKSCKLIPVMIGGMIIQRKRYSLLDFAASLLMSVGLILFTLAEADTSPSFNSTGVTLISLALCADAVIGNVQEQAMRSSGASNAEMVLYSYGIGFLYIFAGEVASGELVPATVFSLAHPWHTYGLAFLFSLTGYLGIIFVLHLVRRFGALLAVTITTFRKAVTMALSFIVFTKPFTMQYVYAGAIVFAGIGINIYEKDKDRIHAVFANYVRPRQTKETLQRV